MPETTTKPEHKTRERRTKHKGRIKRYVKRGPTITDKAARKAKREKRAARSRARKLAKEARVDA